MMIYKPTCITVNITSVTTDWQEKLEADAILLMNRIVDIKKFEWISFNNGCTPKNSIITIIITII